IKNQEGHDQEVHDDWAEGSCLYDPSLRIDRSLFYHPEHCWVKVENCETAKIGIDDLITRLIAKVTVIILPELGTYTAQGNCFAHIIQEDHILPVTAPLSGIVQAVNPRLKKEPELVTADPRGTGWLITIKPDHLEGDLKNLLFGREALCWYQGQEKEIVAQSASLLRQDFPELGPTMQDGGVVINSLEEMLQIMNPLQRTQILDFFFSRPGHSQFAGNDKIKSQDSLP
ncbi:MAG: hypothetical protein L7F78_15395, partial [Syntrophales bacterium LBB04]|nr:hypothetical protein [Syntrophales bacterium LBB04]